ncbi:uncharacterized protein AC631_02080 [Debaryomyces fabryi]|uniref:Tr-type G domain-containing protein n=1 Tax=Debaryomyces fabryi TaxID=58627 RepID=A0A0V1Q182_9ASCO|nr:uncharacterized protein AC631_02080 [Debaryomyces fabryi]KSA02172.1 hypothetical protein AC631_02080 [Debaryomyces fabryi]CUM45446.1 unnamed protein product [Debaryomyces fabryi]
MDEDELYDEFGNLIGDPLDSDADSLDDIPDEQYVQSENEAEDSTIETETEALVIHENNGNGLKLSEKFGPGVETIIAKPYEQTEDAPVIIPANKKKLKVEFTEPVMNNVDEDDNRVKNLPELVYSRDYMISTMNLLPERVRNIAVIGNFHSGKTTFIDMLVLQTHSPSISLSSNLKNFQPLRFMDNHKLEIDRGISIEASPITLLLPDLNERSFIFNIIDTPGHSNFASESTSALQIVDGALLVIDVLEGLTPRDKSLISELMKNNTPITIVLNKIDRLILELRLPVEDFYFKINYTLDDINNFINENEYISTYGKQLVFSPTEGNVIFASSSLEFVFTLDSFTKLYTNNHKLKGVDSYEFSRRLWGDVFYNSDKAQFVNSSNNGKFPRSFNFFILEPIYKIITQTLTYDGTSEKLANLLWDNFKVTLHNSQYKQDSQMLLKAIFKLVFSGSKGFVDLVVNNIPSPTEKVSDRLKLLSSSENASSTTLIAQANKLIASANGERFYSLVRIYQGSIKTGTKVRVLGQNYEEDDDDFRIEVVDELFVPGGRYKIPVKEAFAGSIVLISGIDSIISKGATLYDNTDLPSDFKIFRPSSYERQSVFKVAIEPANPSELPKLLEGLRKLNKAYLACTIKVEESGEHVLFGPGEIYLDCMLHDLRNFFTDDLEIKVSDPMTKFSETCIDTSAIKISTKSSSGNNSISIIAEPVNDNRLSEAIERGIINLSQPLKSTSKILRKEFGWDALSARSVWCFGPEDLHNPSILIDDTLEGETDKKLLYSLKDSINLGFRWSVNEGPLCDEPIRNTKFKILDAVISGSEIQRSGTQIIPMTRKACNTGFLTASPRLMEPIYTVYVTCSYGAITAVKKLLGRRRGMVMTENPVPGTQLFHIEGQVPVIESVGLESDLRLHTQGQAMCFLVFEKWDVVPGDPLDSDCYLPSLRPVPNASLARDFVMKTRKRKGLSGEPNLQKYIDVELYNKLRESGIIE